MIPISLLREEKYNSMYDRKKQSIFFWFIIFVLICFLIVCAKLNKKEKIYPIDELVFVYDDEIIKISTVNEKKYLFLPSSVDLSKCLLEYYSNSNDDIEIKLKASNNELCLKNLQTFDFLKFYGGNNDTKEFNIVIDINSNEKILQSFELNILKSSNLDTLFITSDNPVDEGRLWIDENREHFTMGSLKMNNPNGKDVYNDKLTEIRARGNSSWFATEKKSYLLKLQYDCDLVQTGIKKEKNKTWLLIANSFDPSLLHNRIAYDLANELNLSYSPFCKNVDLYYDGEYMGNYLLCEKVEIGNGRIEIHDLDEEIEKLNPNIDPNNLITKQAVDKFNCEYQYTDNLKNNGNIRGGYLLEIDNAYSFNGWFKIRTGDKIVVKSPKYATKENVEYISSFMNEIIDTLLNNGINPTTRKKH